MLSITDLKGKIKDNRVELPSVGLIDKNTRNIVKLDYDISPLTAITELTTITQHLVYANNREEYNTYYFIRLYGSLKLISKQEFNLIKNTEWAKNKKVEKNNIPASSTLGKQYIDCFYKWC